MDAPATISDVHPGAEDARTAGSDVLCGVSNIETTVSNVHRNKLKNREDAGGQNQAVNTIRIPTTTN